MENPYLGFNYYENIFHSLNTENDFILLPLRWHFENKKWALLYPLDKLEHYEIIVSEFQRITQNRMTLLTDQRSFIVPILRWHPIACYLLIRQIRQLNTYNVDIFFFDTDFIFSTDTH